MHVKTNLTKKDVLDMNLYMSLRMKSSFYSLIYLFIFILIVGFLSVPDGKEINILALVMFSALGAIAGWAAGFIVALLFILCASTDKAGITGEHEFIVLPEGLQENTKVNETLTKWYGVKKLIKTKRFILIQKNSFLFYLIPRRSFEDQDSYEKFWNEILSYHTAAKKNPPD